MRRRFDLVKLLPQAGVRGRPTAIAAVPFLVAGIFGGCTVVDSTNPFDPNTPLENKARGSINGSIQAVLELGPGEIAAGVPGDGEVLVEAAFCDAREGDHGGFEVVLREIAAAAGGDPRVGRATQTPSTGAFTFENVIPGDYTLEILRPGFRTPPPRTISVDVGEAVVLAPLCAINATGPERPQLGPLPAVVNGANLAPLGNDGTPAPIEILNCDPDLSYTVTQTPEGFAFDASATTVTFDGDVGTDGAGACVVDLLLSDLEGEVGRVPWRIEVTAVDGLGNESERTTSFVIRDTLAPSTPASPSAVPGSDRVLLRWSQPGAVGLDDGAASWRVSYGLSARLEDTAAACPFGQPGDGFDIASFAVEGSSPLTVAQTQASLSGLLSGTNVVLQVAAVDAVGNASCFSAPLLARPDEITFQLEVQDTRTIAAGRLAHHRGAMAFARAGAGLQVVDAAGTTTDLAGLVANDVSALGRSFLAAGGPGGLHVVTIPADGSAPVAVTTSVGDDLRSVVARPGLAVVGTTTGIRFLPLVDPTSAAAAVDPGARGDPVVRVMVEGRLLFVFRADGRVQAVHRQNPANELDAVDDEAAPPTSATVVGDELWLAYGDEGIRAFDFSGCFDQQAGCLEERFDVEMPGDGNARAIAVWDDTVLVGVNDAGLLGNVVAAFRPTANSAPRLVGLAFLPADFEVRHLVPDELGFCALSTGARACFRSAVQPLAERERTFTTGGVVIQATVDEDSAWFLSQRGLEMEVQQHGFDGVVRRSATMPQVPSAGAAPFPEGPARLAPAPPLGLGAGYVSIDSYGRAFAALEGESGAMVRLDQNLPANLVSAAADLAYEGAVDEAFLSNALVDLDAGRLVVLAEGDPALGACTAVVLAVVDLVERADGTMGTGAVQAVRLDDANRIAALTVEAGVAFVATAPFRLDAVDLDDLSVTTSVAATRSCDAGDAASFGAFGVQPLTGPAGRELLVGGTADIGGAVAQVSSLVDDAVLPLRLGEAAVAIGTTRDFLTVALATGGALVFRIPAARSDVTALVPSFALPGVRDVQSIQPTGRGIVIADGANGALWHPIR